MKEHRLRSPDLADGHVRMRREAQVTLPQAVTRRGPYDTLHGSTAALGEHASRPTEWSSGARVEPNAYAPTRLWL